MPRLGVNIDHVATIRQARYRAGAGAGVGYGEPDPVRAAHEAELGGAHCITVHLREDRRHVVDRDLEVLRRAATVKLNLEMAGTDEMVALALKTAPGQVTLVPEGRQEVTTEGGLEVAADVPRWRDTVSRLRAGGIIVSAFIDPDPRQVEAAHQAGFDACELHTGGYANEFTRAEGDFLRPALGAALSRVRTAGQSVRRADMRFNAGHGLNYVNVGAIAALPEIDELHIGHSIVSRAIYIGMRAAVREMATLIQAAPAQRPAPDANPHE